LIENKIDDTNAKSVCVCVCVREGEGEKTHILNQKANNSKITWMDVFFSLLSVSFPNIYLIYKYERQSEKKKISNEKVFSFK
jgi:hypothetical protein